MDIITVEQETDRVETVREESEGGDADMAVSVCECASLQCVRATLTVSSVINRAKTASSLSHTLTQYGV